MGEVYEVVRAIELDERAAWVSDRDTLRRRNAAREGEVPAPVRRQHGLEELWLLGGDDVALGELREEHCRVDLRVDTRIRGGRTFTNVGDVNGAVPECHAEVSRGGDGRRGERDHPRLQLAARSGKAVDDAWTIAENRRLPGTVGEASQAALGHELIAPTRREHHVVSQRATRVRQLHRRRGQRRQHGIGAEHGYRDWSGIRRGASRHLANELGDD